MIIKRLRNIKSIAITSSKGGTGKSVISVSLAYTLAHLGFKTLLIDMDLFTGGTTFYTLSDFTIKVEIGLQDVFLMENEKKISSNIIMPIQIPNDFCKGNLFLLPAISNSKKNKAELSLSNKFYDSSRFNLILKYIIDQFENQGFDYIIIDTRGGSDFTSINSVLAADGFIFVTEADKTSWDTGRLFFNTIEDTKNQEQDISCFGFIINKNVLPSGAIETFLKKEWEMPHLATIPLDVNTVKYFQLDQVPIVEDISNSLSFGVLTCIEKILPINDWEYEKTAKFKQLRYKSMEIEKKNRIIKAKVKNMSRILQIMQFFMSSLLISLFTAFFFNKSFSYEVIILFSVISIVLIIINILSIFFKNRLEKIEKYFDKLIF